MGGATGFHGAGRERVRGLGNPLRRNGFALLAPITGRA